MPRRLTTEQFIKKAKAVHGDCYDYSQVEYVRSHDHVKIRCPVHDIFEQTPNSHLNGHGCDKCGGTATVTTEEFIAAARQVHGDRYDYSLVDYVNNRTEVTIICPVHNTFLQTPDSHINAKRGCQDCGGSKPHTRDSFIEKAIAMHGDFYDYSAVKYVNNKTSVSIRCPEHGHYPQTPHDHLAGAGCWRCAGTKPLDNGIFIERAIAVHGDRYDYSQVEYTGLFKNVTIICAEHGPFQQSPCNHIRQESGCPDCGEYGFSPSKPSILYYIAIETDDGDTRYKIGVSNYTVQHRFRKPDLRRIRVVKTWRYSEGRQAVKRESEIIRQHAGDRYHGPPILKDGNTEIFTHDILYLDKAAE